MGLFDAIKGILNPEIISTYEEIINSHSEAFRRWKGRQIVGTFSSTYNFSPSYNDKYYIATHKSEILRVEQEIAEEKAFEKRKQEVINAASKYPHAFYALVKHRLIFLTVIFFFAVGVQAQKRNARYVEYINKYSDLAVEQMKLHKIPASITLAQGLLESGAGYSQLARKSNNHFGIKCGGSWRGRTVRHDDDARNECFRAYKHPRDSYEDHSDFLRRGARYAFLFKLDITDYKGWARGLKKAGYATDPSYANRLITIIEDYDLYKYDRKGVYSERKLKKNPWLMSPHQVYIANDIAYVVARNGDTFKDLGNEFDISWKKLVKYNDLQRDYTLMEGDIIYLKSKKKKASKPYTVYVVKDGDSMHGISQKYGIRLKNLYKMNRKDGEYVPEIGDRLRLR